MADDHRRSADDASLDELADLSRKLDTVAGALVAIADSHSDLLAHVAEAEARRSHDAREVAQRLGAMERQVLALPAAAVPSAADPLGASSVSSVAVDLERVRADLSLSLEVLAQLAESIERLEQRADPPVVPIDVTGLLDDSSQRLMHHTDLALAGALRVIDQRLGALRDALTEAGGGAASVAGFEAGAVMGATQAAWTRLEQRLDAEFDDLGRQLQAMAALIEHTATIAEAVANRPVLTGDQLRRAASAVKESVASAGRSRRDRRGGPRGIGSGPSEPSAD